MPENETDVRLVENPITANPINEVSELDAEDRQIALRLTRGIRSTRLRSAFILRN